MSGSSTLLSASSILMKTLKYLPLDTTNPSSNLITLLLAEQNILNLGNNRKHGRIHVYSGNAMLAITRLLAHTDRFKLGRNESQPAIVCPLQDNSHLLSLRGF